MRLLLDTHTLVWWDNDELPATIVRRIQRAEAVFVSAATAWEIAIKAALGKMVARESVAEMIADYGFIELPISIGHADFVRTLAPHHKDPFDRILVAQATLDDLVIVSKDADLRRYDVPMVWL